MVSIAHVVNPVALKPPSDLAVAQPVTFESMRVAHEYAASQMKVEPCAAFYPEDEAMVPPYLKKLRLLDRSLLDLKSFKERRKLPLIRDILDRVAEASDADYIIYTNADIALMPQFYVSIALLLEGDADAVSVTRRTISRTHASPSELPLMYAELGEPHPGNDCFVFPRKIYSQFELGHTAIGAGHFARMLLLNMMVHANNFRVFRDLHLTFHLGDDKAWKSDRFADYVGHQRQEFYAVFRKYQQAERLPDNEFTRRWAKRSAQALRRKAKEMEE